MDDTDPEYVMVIECPRCGHTWHVGRREVRDGTWRRCPVCAPADERPKEDDE